MIAITTKKGIKIAKVLKTITKQDKTNRNSRERKSKKKIGMVKRIRLNKYSLIMLKGKVKSKYEVNNNDVYISIFEYGDEKVTGTGFEPALFG